MRRGLVYINETLAGLIAESDGAYRFQYDAVYLQTPAAKPISLTLPLQTEAYTAPQLFSFFDGLIPQGWLLDIAEKNWKLSHKDRMGLLLTVCQDCVGNVKVLAEAGHE